MSRTLETVILCPVCNEIFENGEDARLCCAPEAEARYTCIRCQRDDHASLTDARLCCHPMAIGGQQCNQCLLLDNQCQCDFEPAPAGAQLH